MPISERSVPPSQVFQVAELVRENKGEVPSFEVLVSVAPDLDYGQVGAITAQVNRERVSASRADKRRRQQKAGQ